MTRDDLLSSAKRLEAPSPEVAAEFADKANRLADTMNRLMDQRSDVLKLVGTDNIDMMHDNHRNHARFMTALLQTFNAEVLVDTVLWVFRAYTSHGFSLAYWPAQLDTWVELFQKDLSEKAFVEIYPIYDWLIINQPHFVALSQSDGSQMSSTPTHE